MSSPVLGTRLANATKAATLKYLQGSIRASIIDHFLSFTLEQWTRSSKLVLDTIAAEFGDEQVIIRSSAIQEDKPGLSHAGYFRSEIAKGALRRSALKFAIERVVSSYSRNDRVALPEDQFIAQRFLDKVACSGVLLTRDWPHLTPYYVIDFDDETGRTDRITKGAYTRQIRLARWTAPKHSPKRWKALLVAAREIEALLRADNLQIEFALTEDGDVHVFQVRPLSQPGAGQSKDDEAIVTLLTRLQRKLRRASQEGYPQAKFLLTDMSDWNPAEMLGSRCNELDYSLYRFLITESTWNKARQLLGYSDAGSRELMCRVADKPYIDVKVSLHSLSPASIPADLRDHLIDFGLTKINRQPELQDKLEFTAAFSCFDLSFPQRADELRAFGFSAKEIDLLAKELLLFTNNLLDNADAMLASHAKAVRRLENYGQHLLLNLSDLSIKEAARSARFLLTRCRDYGVLPFAQAARLSFVTMAILRSVAQREGDVNFVYDVLASMQTIAGKMTRDLSAVHEGALSRAAFLKRYGHLRPGTYNILMPRLDQISNLFDTVGVGLSNRLGRRGKLRSPGRLDHIDQVLKRAGLNHSISELISLAKKALKARELLKFHFTRTLSNLLELFAGIGSLAEFSRQEVALLDVESLLELRGIDDYKGAHRRWGDIIKSRQREKDLYRCIALPPVLSSADDLTLFEYYEARPNFVTRSRIEGPIIQLTQESVRDVSNLASRIVLIENADPGYDWLFSCGLMGLVTKYGGVASHMAIRCGEFGLPAAIGCGEILFNNIRRGGRVCIDGESETVFVIQ